MKMLPEDSAHAILTNMLASINREAVARRMQDSEFPAWYNARALSQVPKNYLGAERSGDPSMRSRSPMNPFAAEFMAQGVLPKLGILTAEQTILTAGEARVLPSDYVVKVAGERSSQNLNWKSADVIKSIRSGWCLASRSFPKPPASIM
jgi:hypothetical protein